jgi:hypothetical protein
MAKGANALFDFTVLDDGYTHGKVQSISGTPGLPSTSINDPEDTLIDDIAPYTDGDPEVFSYMDGDTQTVPRLLLCNVTTDFSTPPPYASTGKYSAYTPVAPSVDTRKLDWDLVGTKDLQLVDPDGNPVAGNPYGVAQVGDFLYILGYDTGNIYTVQISEFEGASGPTYQVFAVTEAVAQSGTFYPHGAAILSLTDTSNSATYVYGLFTMAENDPDSGYPINYNPSSLVRYTVDPENPGALIEPLTVSVGANANALVPVPGSTGADSFSVLVTAIGGIQDTGTTNGTDSSLSVVPAFADFPDGETAQIAFTGDATGPVTPDGAYDFKGAAVSEDGAYAYLLTATYSKEYLYNWRLYQTTAAKIIAATEEETQTLSEAVAAGVLVDLDSTADPVNGDPGVEWEIQYENAADPIIGRLWFVKGSPIRISMGNSYSVFKIFDAGSGGPLYSPAFYVNSADLIGETIYAAARGISKDTRLVKGNATRLAAAAAAAASEDEDDK